LLLGLIIGLSLREYPWNILFCLALIGVLREVRASFFVAGGLVVGALLSPPLLPRGMVADVRLDQVARVVSIPRVEPDWVECEVEVSGQRLELSAARTTDISFGDRVHLVGVAKPLREGSEGYYLAKGIVGRIRPVRLDVVETGPNVFRWAIGVRERFLAFTASTLPAESAAMVDALCFNVTGGLDPSLRDQLRETGTVHIISASGLHVLVLSAALDWLLGLFPIPRVIRIGLLGLLLGFYACAAGLHPAIVRSVLMAMVGLTAYLWQREADLLSSMSLAGIVYLLFSPLSIYDLGFQFSFVAIAAFGLFGAYRDSDFLVGKVANAVRTGLLAFVATFPLVVFHFGFVSLSTLPANLLIAPLVWVAVVFSMGCFGLSFLWPDGASALMAHGVDPLVGLTRGVLDGLGNMSASIQTHMDVSGYLVVLFSRYAFLSAEPLGFLSTRLARVC